MDHLKKGSHFEQRERKYANTWGGGGRARGHNSLQKHFFCTPFVFIEIVSNPFSRLCTSKVATELKIQNLTVFRTAKILRFSTIFNFRNAVKIIQLVPSKI